MERVVRKLVRGLMHPSWCILSALLLAVSYTPKISRTPPFGVRQVHTWNHYIRDSIKKGQPTTDLSFMMLNWTLISRAYVRAEDGVLVGVHDRWRTASPNIVSEVMDSEGNWVFVEKSFDLSIGVGCVPTGLFFPSGMIHYIQKRMYHAVDDDTDGKADFIERTEIPLPSEGPVKDAHDEIYKAFQNCFADHHIYSRLDGAMQQVMDINTSVYTLNVVTTNTYLQVINGALLVMVLLSPISFVGLLIRGVQIQQGTLRRCNSCDMRFRSREAAPCPRCGSAVESVVDERALDNDM